MWPGDSVYPDFGAPRVRRWWAGLQRFLTEKGVSGVWNDMNEPASFRGPLPDNVLMTDEDRVATHGEMTTSTGTICPGPPLRLEGSHRQPPSSLPAPVTGSQKYAVVWPGDNQSLWNHGMAIPRGMARAAPGHRRLDGAHSGAQARWAQVLSRCSDHSARDTRMQERWRGTEVMALWACEARYALSSCPHYRLFRQCEQMGLPPLRPLVLHYEQDPNVRELNDEFLLGENLLVAPVVEQGARRRMVYLPAGEWYDFWTGEKHTGGWLMREAPLDLCPIYVKAGTILPLYPDQRYTDELADPALILRCYPGEGAWEHYRDNGRDYAYQDGAYTLYAPRTPRACTRSWCATATGLTRRSVWNGWGNKRGGNVLLLHFPLTGFFPVQYNSV